ncbi:MAG TPA: tRNA lysidine(34) synthetase TilS [Microscillaceae bacterium]|jgi:tRNA(Ile)-lysidine synthase|nr:tRNA lysidine(34) synthetase TilS [Microscillaceae bacterium]
MVALWQEMVAQRQLFTPHDRLLLAVSGGLDSVVLLDLCAKAGYQVAVAHTNFQLRGQESDDDAAFVATLAQHYGVPLHSAVLPVDAAENNVQLQARQLRYAWFDTLCQTESYDFILTAHHLNDSLETVLLNLTRGTGLAGLQGIPERNGRIIRPLLGFSRAQLEAYAQEASLRWRDDSSNASDKYRRNLIRHHVVSQLQVLNPSLEQTFAQTLAQLQGVWQSWLNAVVQPLRDLWQQQGLLAWLPKAPFAAADATAAVTLHQLLRPYGFAFGQVAQIVAALEHPSGTVFESATHRLTLDRETLWVSPLQDEERWQPVVLAAAQPSVSTATYQLSATYSRKPTDFSPKAKPHEAFFDAAAVHFPLTVRLWQVGDAMQPFGLPHRQKISDMLINHKMPMPLKKYQLVLEDAQGELLWLIGIRTAQRAVVSPQTEQLLHLQFQWLVADEKATV